MLKTVFGLNRQILNIIYKTLFPLKCTGCNKEGSFLCRLCKNKLAYLDLNKSNSIKSKYISKVISSFPYKEPISTLIILGKYSFMSDVFSQLALLSSEHIKNQNIILQSFILCPIPLSKQRLKWRGFNQTEKLCQTFKEKLGLNQIKFLIRQKNTKTQKDLSGAERVKNVKNCFTLNPKYQKDIPGKKIILVDDVVTTGSTLNSAAKILHEAGAETVWALTIAQD